VRLRRAARDAEMLQQVLTDEMRRMTERRAYPPQIHAWLAKVDREQLRVAVGEVQKVDVAEARKLVHALCRRCSAKRVTRGDRHSRRCSD